MMSGTSEAVRVGAGARPGGRRIAVLDLGSNSFHLLVGEVGADGEIRVLADAKEMVRLGSSAVRTGRIPDAEGSRALAVVRSLADAAREFAGARVVAVATSAVREAENGPDFLRLVREQVGVNVELLSGEVEAWITHVGARRSAPAAARRVATIDVGGGSVDVAVGEGDRKLLAMSLPLGCLRMRERFVPFSGRMGREEVDAIGGCVREHAADAANDVRRLAPDAFVLSAGTARALRALSARGALGKLDFDDVDRIVSVLCDRSPAQIQAMGVCPDRKDTLGPGAVVVLGLMSLLGAREATVSPHGLREGVILREAARSV